MKKNSFTMISCSLIGTCLSFSSMVVAAENESSMPPPPPGPAAIQLDTSSPDHQATDKQQIANQLRAELSLTAVSMAALTAERNELRQRLAALETELRYKDELLDTLKQGLEGPELP